MGWLGLDDTDLSAGGCTTKAFYDLLNHLPDDVVAGEPRLVRLWPFARRRTRGNAAVSVELTCTNEAALMAHLDAWWDDRLSHLAGAVLASSISDREQHPTSPGMVWFSTKPSEELYWRAVKEEVRLSDLPGATVTWGGHGRTLRHGGGCMARANMHVGSDCVARRVCPRTTAHRFGGLAGGGRNGGRCVLPRPEKRHGTGCTAGPSPVLFGIRAIQHGRLSHARCSAGGGGYRTRASAGCVSHQTASGDHLRHAFASVRGVGRGSIRSASTLASKPTARRFFPTSVVGLSIDWPDGFNRRMLFLFKASSTTTAGFTPSA